MYFQLTKVNPGLLVTLTLLLYTLNIWADESVQNTISPGKVVSLHYTLSLPDGEVVDSNVDTFPLKYRQGDGKVLPALEVALAGLAAGDKKSVTLPPEDAYGPVNAAAFMEVPINQVPENNRQVGSVFTALGSRGTVRVTEIKEDSAILDLNHPLAGKTLTFDITVISVE